MLYRVRIPKIDVPLLQSLVRDFMPPSMLYRIGL